MEGIEYNDQIENLFKNEAEMAECYGILHRLCYEHYNRLTNLINIPTIVLSSVIGFTTGVDIQFSNMNLILGIASVFVGVIKSLDSYFQLGKRAETHRIVSLAYFNINKRIAIELLLPRENRIIAKDLLNIIKVDQKNLQDIEPLIPKKIIKIFNRRYPTNNTAKPPILNGLTSIKVYDLILRETLDKSKSNINDEKMIQLPNLGNVSANMVFENRSQSRVSNISEKNGVLELQNIINNEGMM